MGREASCIARFGRRNTLGIAHLDANSFRFAGDFRLNIPIATLRNVRASDGVLSFTSPDGDIRFELGEEAEAWAQAILKPAAGA